MLKVESEYGITSLTRKGPSSIVCTDLIVVIRSVFDTVEEEEKPFFKEQLQRAVGNNGTIWMTDEEREALLANRSGKKVLNSLKDLLENAHNQVNKKTEEPAAEDVDLEQMTRDAVRAAMEKRMGEKNDASGAQKAGRGAGDCGSGKHP